MAINLKTIAAAALAALLTASCGSEVRVPDNATPTQEAANISQNTATSISRKTSHRSTCR